MTRPPKWFLIVFLTHWKNRKIYKGTSYTVHKKVIISQTKHNRFPLNCWTFENNLERGQWSQSSNLARDSKDGKCHQEDQRHQLRHSHHLLAWLYTGYPMLGLLLLLVKLLFQLWIRILVKWNSERKYDCNLDAPAPDDGHHCGNDWINQKLSSSVQWECCMVRWGSIARSHFELYTL